MSLITRLNFNTIADGGDDATGAFQKLDANDAALDAAMATSATNIGTNTTAIAANATAITNLAASLGTAATKNVGSVAGTVAAGDDARILASGSFRNKLLNARFDRWSIGTTVAAVSTGYVPTLGSSDCWAHASNGSTIAISQQAFSLTDTTIAAQPRFFLRSVVVSAAGASNLAYITQAIGDARTLSGRDFIFSVWLKSDAARSIGIEVLQVFGSGGSPSSSVIAFAGKTAVTTNWVRYTFKATMPSVSGKTFGTTDDTSNLQLRLWFDAGTNYNGDTTSLGQQSGSFDISCPQLEEARLGQTVASDFEIVDSGIEQIRCLRRVYVWTAGSPAQTFAGGGTMFSNTLLARPVHKYPLPMRRTPDTRFLGVSRTQIGNAQGVATISSPYTSASQYEADYTSSASATVGQSGLIYFDGGGTFIATADYL